MHLQNTLHSMSAKHGCLFNSQRFFQRMGGHDVVSWAAIISAHAKQAQYEKAINMFQRMLQQEGVVPNKALILVVLKACTALKSLQHAKQVHSCVLQTGMESEPYIGNSLISMYVNCNCLECAQHVFDRIHQPDVVSWTGMIVGYALNGYNNEALLLLEEMTQKGVIPDRITFISILKTCGCPQFGKAIHGHVIKHGLESDVSVANTLIGMYAKCGELENACQLFDNMCSRDVVSWNAMISGYVQHGYGNKALMLFEQMRQQRQVPDNVTFISILKACASMEAVERGKQIHTHAIEYGLELDVFVGTALVDMYAKCGSLKDAEQIFNKMHKKNVVSWNAMITGYIQQDQNSQALNLFDKMLKEAIKPNDVTYLVVLKACSSLAALEFGKRLHGYLIKTSFQLNTYIGNALIDMYAKCGSLQDAYIVFNELHERNVVSWTALIAGHINQGYNEEALALFQHMQQEGVKPNRATFIIALKACAGAPDLETGRNIHSLIIDSGFDSDLFVQSTLVDMYAKCNCLINAQEVFDRMHVHDLLSWNVIITGYTQQGHAKDALALLTHMQQDGVKPDNCTFASIIRACGSLAVLELGKLIHAQIIESHFESHISLANNLIDMYTKCGCIASAHRVFHRMHERDVVSWNVMIAGYAWLGCDKEALILLEEMQCEGTKPNNHTYISLLKACGSLKSLDRGKEVHADIIRSGYEGDLFVASALIEMYGKCGNINDALEVFKRLHEIDVVSCNVLISGFNQQGQSEEVFALFEKMQWEGIIPNHITFEHLLVACANLNALGWGKQIHACVIKAGYEFDCSMKSRIINMYVKCGRMEDAHVEFNSMHERDVPLWNVMVAGYVKKEHWENALKLYEQMQLEGVEPDSTTFLNILKACIELADIQYGKHVHGHIISVGFEMDAFIGSMLIDMYAKCGSIWDAHQVFDRIPNRDVILWNTMISGYIHGGHAEKGLSLFRQMQHESIEPNNSTFVSILKACISLSALEVGKEIHVYAIESGCELDLLVRSILIEMYAKCGSIEDARRVFNVTCRGDVVSWTTMIAAYAEQGYGEEALSLFDEMIQAGVQPNAITFVSVLAACNHGGLVDEGYYHFHSMSQNFSIIPGVEHYSCVVDLLGRAGRLDEAVDFIYKIPVETTDTLWMALLGACRVSGNLELGRRSSQFILNLKPKCLAAYALLSSISTAAG